MENFLITLYFGKEEEGIAFEFPGNSIEEVVQTFMQLEGKQPIELEGGYRIINFNRVNFIDVAQRLN